jgi:hypothetical protein
MYGITEIADHFVSYDFYISNGEGNTAHEDMNSNAATGLRLNVDLPYLDNTTIGTSLYHDVLNDGRDKTAVGLHTQLRQDNYELQAEYADALLKPDTGSKYHSRGYYLQGLYRFNNWGAGLRYDYYNYDTRLAVDEITRSLFANYHLSENLTLKLEHHIINYESPSIEDYNKTILSINAYLGN